MTTSAIPDRGQGAWDTIADEYLEEIIAARGTAASLNARLGVSINDDGTLKSPTPASGWWTEEADTIAFVSANSFTVSLDKTAIYTQNRAIKATVTAGTVYSHVLSSAYDAGTGLTTVTIRDSVLDSGLAKIYYGQDPNSDAYATPAIVPLGGKTGGDLKVASAGSDVTIKPGYREVGGKWYHWNSEITFTIGPSGSNADSDAVPTSADMVYIYIDESSLPSDNATELTAANFISKSTEPTRSNIKHGFYDGDDRLIGALWHDGSNLVAQEKAGNTHWYMDSITEVAGSSLNAVVTFAAVPPNGIAPSVILNAWAELSSASYTYIQIIRVDDSGTDVGSGVYLSDVKNILRNRQTIEVGFVTNTSCKLHIILNADTYANIYTLGFRYHESV